MAVSVSITFHNLKPSEWMAAEIRQRAGRLARYGRLLRACRVVVDVPHRHKVQGNRLKLHVELAVPDDVIAVTRDAPLTQVRQDPRVIVREAFDVARRRLQDYSRRHRRAVKRHSLPSVRAPRARTPRAARKAA